MSENPLIDFDNLTREGISKIDATAPEILKILDLEPFPKFDGRDDAEKYVLYHEYFKELLVMSQYEEQQREDSFQRLKKLAPHIMGLKKLAPQYNDDDDDDEKNFDEEEYAKEKKNFKIHLVKGSIIEIHREKAYEMVKKLKKLLSEEFDIADD